MTNEPTPQYRASLLQIAHCREMISNGLNSVCTYIYAMLALVLHIVTCHVYFRPKLCALTVVVFHLHVCHSRYLLTQGRTICSFAFAPLSLTVDARVVATTASYPTDTAFIHTAVACTQFC